MSEKYFFYAPRSVTSLLGMGRFMLAAAFLSGAAGFLIFRGTGFGLLLFLLVSLYFAVAGMYQLLNAGKLSQSAVLLDEDGLYIQLRRQNRQFSADEVCLEEVEVRLLKGFGRKQRVYRALLVNNEIMLVDIESTAGGGGISVFHRGSPFLITAADFEEVHTEAEVRGWLRPCPLPEVPVCRQITPLVSYVYALASIIAFFAFFVLNNRRFAIAALIGGLGFGAFFLLSRQKKSPQLPKS